MGKKQSKIMTPETAANDTPNDQFSPESDYGLSSFECPSSW